MNKPDVNDTQVIRPRRVFKCEQEGRFMIRSGVWKDHKGEYHCSSCSGIVQDVTDTMTAQNLMEILGI